jgi:creatinine amidohydrolase
MVLTVSNTYRDLEEAGINTAVLPVGSIEQHGPHLPLGTDWIIANKLAEEVAERLEDVYLLPAIPYSNSQEHLGFKGTISVKPNTLAKTIKDIIESLYLHGITRVVIISGHAGNWILKPTIRELNLQYPELNIIQGGAMGERPEDIHAGMVETSQMLYISKDLVKKEKLIDSVPETTQEYLDYVGMRPLSGDGVWGKPSQSSVKKGEEIQKRRIEDITSYIKQTFQSLESIEREKERKSIIPKR